MNTVPKAFCPPTAYKYPHIPFLSLPSKPQPFPIIKGIFIFFFTHSLVLISSPSTKQSTPQWSLCRPLLDAVALISLAKKR
ncbi:hypothetical protein PTKIN_Ptkin11bG0068000 [Pterospermum kingtungense]